MPVSALVITLSPASGPLRAATLRALATIDGLSLGEPRGGHVPAVLETADLEGGIRLIRRVLPDLLGVGCVHVVHVDMTDLSPAHPEPCEHDACTCEEERR